MIEKRVKILIAFFLVIALLSVFLLLERMVIHRNRYLNERYTDRRFTALMEQLIVEKAFRIEGKEIALDESALRDKKISGKTEKRIKDNLSFLYTKNGKIFFDWKAVSIVSTEISNEERTLRGRFLDRNGILLVRSVLSKKTGRQKREYLFGPEFYPVTGHNSPVFGKRNLENALDEYLQGTLHQPVCLPSTEPLRRLKAGDDVILTLDSKVQRCAYNLMKGRRGAVVVLRVKSGEVLAAVSAPSFDPNTEERAKWREKFDDRNEKCYENRAFSVCYPPGSTFKTVVTSAWLEKEGGNEFEVMCTGGNNRYDISDIHVHGKVGLTKAFAESCNIFFSEMGVRLGKDVLDYAEKFGFNRTMSLTPQLDNLRYGPEMSLAYPSHEYPKGNKEVRKYKEIDFKRNPKIVAQGAIGQNLVTATPLQMALVASAIANRGILLNPCLVKEIRTGDGKKVLFASRPVAMGRAISANTAIQLSRLMEGVMERGTGKDVKKIYLENGKYFALPKDPSRQEVRVAGKTGTAEVGDRNGNRMIDADEKPHSWFIGFVPADKPEVAVAVIAENQGFGSLTAAPIAVKVMAKALNTAASR